MQTQRKYISILKVNPRRTESKVHTRLYIYKIIYTQRKSKKEKFEQNVEFSNKLLNKQPVNKQPALTCLRLR